MPAETLNSLESGRLLLQVDFGRGIISVSARPVNNVKRENLEKTGNSGKLKYKASLSTKLVQDSRRPGELTSHQMDGRRHKNMREDRRGAPPKSEGNIYTLEITYALDGGNSCTARFASEDAFHWKARQELTM